MPERKRQPSKRAEAQVVAQEKYRLIFAGERCGDYAKLPLDKHVELLKLSDKANSKILKGEKVALKSGLSLTHMQRQQEVFTKLGLVTEHQLQLSPEILTMGLRDREAEVSVLETDLPVYVLEDELGSLMLYNKPDSRYIRTDLNNIGQTETNTSQARRTVSVNDNSYQFSGLILILVAAILGFSLQSYFSAIFGLLGIGGIVASLINLLVFIACVMILPRLFQPLVNNVLLLDDEGIELFEHPRVLLGTRRFYWESDDSAGEFFISSDTARATSLRPLYQWSAHAQLSDSNTEALEDFQSQSQEQQQAPADFAQVVLQKLRPSLFQWLPKSSGKALAWAHEPATAVTDDTGEIVALIYEKNEAAYQIVRAELQDNSVLHAFCLAIHRRVLA